MTTITKERVAEFIKSPLDNGLTRGEQMELARIALASLEAVPVAYTEKCEITNMQATGLYLRGFPDNSHGRDIELYISPPAPVLPDELTPKQASRSYSGEVRGYRDGWNACRAAMQGKAEPVDKNIQGIVVHDFVTTDWVNGKVIKKKIGTIKAEVKELGTVIFTADSNGEVFMSLERCDVDIDIVGKGTGPHPDWNDKLEITGYVLLARICQKIFPRIKEFYEIDSDLNFIINGERVILPICSNSEPQWEV